MSVRIDSVENLKDGRVLVNFSTGGKEKSGAGMVFNSLKDLLAECREHVMDEETALLDAIARYLKASGDRALNNLAGQVL